MKQRPKSPWYRQSLSQQQAWKARTATLPEAARVSGRTMVEQRGQSIAVGPFPICLPLRYALYNLLSDVRAQALERFARYDIFWHGQTEGPSGERWPSTHLLDSQVQCANVLLGLDPDQLLSFVREAEPEAVRLVPIEEDHPVAFEWNGLRDYLGEGRGRPRRRGQFCTSADALLVAERKSGRTAILVEWKYTETYDQPVPVRGSGGTDRRTVYRDRYEAAPFLHRPPIDAFLHEPHYQLLRQALLGHGMVEAREHGVDRVVLLHVMPAQNRTLLATVPEELAEFGETVPAVWQTLLGRGYRWFDPTAAIAAHPALSERYSDNDPRVVSRPDPKRG